MSQSDYQQDQKQRQPHTFKDQIIIRAAKKNAQQAAQNNESSEYFDRRKFNGLTSQSLNRFPSTAHYINKNVNQNIVKRNDLSQQQTSSAIDVQRQEYNELLFKFQSNFNTVQYKKLHDYFTSTGFQKIVQDRFANAKSLQNTIKDLMGIAIKIEDIKILIQHHNQSKNDDYGMESSQKRSQLQTLSQKIEVQGMLTKSMQDLPYLNNTQQKTNHDQYFSPSSKSRFSDVSRSTSFSRPFTSISFVSSTTLGASLTQKIERLSKVTLKSIAKTMIQCQQQIEQQLRQNKVNLKTMLTVPEIVMYLQNTDVNLSLTQFQNLLVGVMLIQHIKSDMLISFKSVLQSCQNYIDQSDIDQKDFFNKSKGDKILDDVRDYIYQKHQDLRTIFMKITETDADQCDRTIMTQDHFTKFAKQIIGDKYSTREVEMIYRNLVSKKALSFAKFTKIFRQIKYQSQFHSHKPVDEVWFNTGIKQLRDYIVRKKFSSADAFERFLIILGTKESGKINKTQFREVLKRESLPFSLPQIDFLFSKFDKSQDGYIDSEKWTCQIQDDRKQINSYKFLLDLNPLQMLRETILSHNLTGEDLLQRMRKCLMDPALNFNQFKESIIRIDSSLTPLQTKNLFDQLKNNEESKVEIRQLIVNLTGDHIDTVNFKREMNKKISNYLTQNNKLGQLRDLFEKLDVQNEGKITTEQLFTVLKTLKMPLQQIELERYIRHLNKNQKGQITYQKLLNQYENTKDNYPLKEVGMRLTVFLKQNNLNSRSLLDKLIQTKNHSKNNQTQSKSDKFVSISFFAKFIKAKVDKKKSIQEVKELMRMIDLDKDNKIGQSDLEAFIGRVNFQEFFENKSSDDNPMNSNQFTPSTGSKTMSKSVLGVYQTSSAGQTMNFISSNVDQSNSNKLFPVSQLKGEKLVEVLNKIKEDMKVRNINLVEAFKILDVNNTGLLSFGTFSKQFDKLSKLSQINKEKLFGNMDVMNIGLISFEQFMGLMSRSAVKLRDEYLQVIQDSFEWEQNTIKQISQWIKTKNYSVSEAFKIIDQDFDGIISILDLKHFLLEVLKLKPDEIYQTKLQRLYKIFDMSKSDNIFQSDFESMFAQIQDRSTLKSSTNGWQSSTKQSRFSQKKNNTLPLIEEENQIFDWQTGCIYQIGNFITKSFTSIEDSFERIVSQNTEEELKIRYLDFVNFLQANNVLHGFNLTQQLYQKLFASMDPHKKGYLTLADWKLLFSIIILHYFLENFNDVGTNLLDIQSALTSSFNSAQEAFNYMILKSKSKEITFEGFYLVIQQLLPGRLDKNQLLKICQRMVTQGGQTFTKNDFLTHFGGLRYKGETQMQDMISKQLMRSQMTRSMSQVSPGNIQSVFQSKNRNQLLQESQQETVQKMGQTPDINVSRGELRSSSLLSRMLDPITQSQMSSNMTMEKLRRNLKTMNIINIKDICGFNEEGKTSSVEFKNALKKMGINSKEIDRLMELLVYNEEGMIDLNILHNKLQRIGDSEELLDRRNNQRIVGIKKMMYEQMTSPEDAFRYFDKEGKGRLTYQDFQNLITNLYELYKKEPPNYPIIKDLFDQIDIRKDGIIDVNEWTKTFLSQGVSKLNQTTQNFFQGAGSLIDNNISTWVTSKDYVALLTLIAKNRKSLEKLFKANVNTEGFILIEQGKKLFMDYVQKQMMSENGMITQIEDWKLEQLIAPFQELKHGDLVLNHQKMLDTIKDRQRVLAGFPKNI